MISWSRRLPVLLAAAMAALVIAGTAAHAETADAGDGGTAVTVAADRGWQPSGLEVTAGQTS